MTETKNELRQSYRKQEATPNQRKNWVDYQCLKKELRKLTSEVFQHNKNSKLDKKQFHKLQLCFILAFHLRYPLRRDLSTVTYSNDPPPEGNVIDLHAQKLFLRKYKTSKTHGEKVYQFTREQWKLFSWLRKQHRLRGLTGGHLLYNTYWKPLNPNAMTSYLKKVCKDYMECCKGKQIGCCLLRHIVISWKHRKQMTITDRDKLASELCHTPEQ